MQMGDVVWTDVRQAVRRLIRAPWLSLVVIATLALSIAANITIFSLLKPTVLQKLAAPSPDELVSIGGLDARTNTYLPIHTETLRALQSSPVFSRLGAFSTSIVRIESDGIAFDTGVEGVTAEYFDVLGVAPAAGRVIGAADDPYSAVGVMTRRLAIRVFGDQPAVGRTLIVDGRPVEIIGVLAGDFIGVRMDGGDDLFLPLGFLRGTVLGSDQRGLMRAQSLVGRLAPGGTVESARAEVLARWPAIRAGVAAGAPQAQRIAVENQRLTVDAFGHGFSLTRDRFGPSLSMVMGLALALLAVGCVNLSGLMLARGLERHHEFAVRVAMGVSRARLLQQTVIDGLLLSAIALAAAIPLAWWASDVLVSMVSVAKSIPLGKATPDMPIILLAAAAAIGAGLILGILPARQALSSNMDDVLRGRGTAHRLRGMTRAVLITQIAVSMILVVGAGLFGRTLTHLYANDVTARTREVIFTRPSRNPLERGKPLPSTYYADLQQQLKVVPGADGAAFSLMYPGWLSAFGRLPSDTVATRTGTRAQAVNDLVSPAFFEVVSIPLLRGRDFTWADAGTDVVIINEPLARALGNASDLVGQRIEITSGQKTTDAEIIGVVAGASVTSIRERDVAAYYRPLPPDFVLAEAMMHVGVRGDVATVQRGYVDAIGAQRQHFVRAVFTMSLWVDNAVVEQRLIAGMASVAATLAMVLASVGLFGLLAYSVSSRVREIGVRMSVGATARAVIAMIVREGMVVAIPGVLVGIPLALAAAWAVRSQLFGVSATDPWTIGAAALLFTATAAVASWLPARRASRIQPMDALRQD